MSVLAALLVWALRDLGTAPAADAGFLHAVVHALAFVLATFAGLAALVAALGYLDLADLLGVGLLLALLLSVGLLAVRVALDDVLRVALVYGPVARLRTVQRHRAAIDRGLRATIDVAILGIWTWFVLGRFQVRDPLLEVVAGSSTPRCARADSRCRSGRCWRSWSSWWWSSSVRGWSSCCSRRTSSRA
jgi:hypothetical protein